MLPIHNILFARDFSPSAEHAAPLAVRIAHETKALLHVLYAEVLHGDPWNPSDHPLSLLDTLKARAREATESQQAETFDPANVRMKHVMVRGIAPAPAILDYARDNNIDLIVMGTHGRRGIRRALLGSVAEEVVRHASCPVLTVRQVARDVPALEVRTILVPIDFTPHAEQSLREAKALASLFGARLLVFHVVEERLHPAFYSPVLQSVYDVQPNINAQSLARLKELYYATEGPDAPCAFAVRYGIAADEILQYAHECESDLIIMTPHQRTGVDRFLTGSVTETVVRRAPCPVLTLNQEDAAQASASEHDYATVPFG